MVYCNVCKMERKDDELEMNHRSMLECPQCGTEIKEPKEKSGATKRDQHTHKK